jgi:DNA (cytosine-5)-methyltransferase 1
MRAIELFAGIGGFRVGLERCGISVIWANDIDAKCCSVYRRHYGAESIVCDDLRDVEDQIPNHDLLTAGFPCQPFSAAGKKEGIRDRLRGTLFAEIVNILESMQPTVFILENVKRLLTMEEGQHFKVILTALMGAGYSVEWRILNAKTFGLAQNRERVFLVGKKGMDWTILPPEVFGADHSVVTLPGEFHISTSLFPPSKLGDIMEPVETHQDRFLAYGIASQGLTTMFDIGEMFPQKPPQVLRDILEEEVDPCFDFTDITNGWVQKNTEVNEFINGVEVLSNQDGGRRMGYTIFGDRGLAPTLTATASRHYERYRIRGRYRRLTNKEYARLQGFPDDWCAIVSVYDQYALFGNAVPPHMVEWVASRLIARTRSEQEQNKPCLTSRPSDAKSSAPLSTRS